MDPPARRAVAIAAATASLVAFWAAARQWRRQRRAKLPALRWLPGRFAVVRLPAGSEPATALGLAAGQLARLPFATVTHTAEETSVVLGEELAPAPRDGMEVEAGWACFVVQGPLDFALVGILAHLSAALAAAGVSIFAISTFDTDYVLLKQCSRGDAETALCRQGYHFAPEKP
eukprot:jgi/Tetstr1/464937/TSEL_009671.t1